MKLKVGQWTSVQNHLTNDSVSDDLWRRIEHRTWGKHGYTVVNIGLNKTEQAMVDRALASMTEGERRNGTPA